MFLQRGSTGFSVVCLQHALHMLCCSAGAFDGTFGGGTEEAVKKYQAKAGLEEDGKVGDITWNSLRGEIRIIQKAMSDKGYYNDSLDGVAGNNTYNALLTFQSSNGLAADGQVGPATRYKLFGSSSPVVGDADFPLKKGDSGDKVVYLQQGLRILCCNPGTIDGTFGNGTYNAVIKFQSKYGLETDGMVGPATWNKMKSLIKEIQSALVNKGYEIGGVDGVAGNGTYEGVLDFQRNKVL